MMKKLLIMLFILLFSISLFGCNKGQKVEQNNLPTQQNEEKDRQDVTALVKDFGQKLQLVSLQAAPQEVRQNIQNTYGGFVTPTLLNQWQTTLQNVPGRLVSSPWPDRIEVSSVEKISPDSYAVKGEIIEITSVEKVNGGAAARQPIDLVVNRSDNRWLIDSITLGQSHKEGTIVYQNNDFGFNFTLPTSWQGYSLVDSKWEGLGISGASQGQVVASGPMISIRHPQWTAQTPRQDIPIMVFTPAQWNALQKGEFHIGAAPIGPKELGHNTRYVFALPARYNFAFPTGYEEVERILAGNPLQAK